MHPTKTKNKPTADGTLAAAAWTSWATEAKLPFSATQKHPFKLELIGT